MEFAPTDEADLDEYCRTTMATPPLAPDEEKELGRLIEAGDSEARERLVRANLRLVVEAARRHAGEGLALRRLLQAGTEGLLHAVEAFDPRGSGPFAEHASQWIEQAIQHAVFSGERAGKAT
jgi:RNA polymerase primary sigma factor